ncbi:phage integrase SAM-like domain-containing protein [Paenibacillus sp. P13VS]|uniref:phage integrase SAM-like domain-containing protein n=1 Tax=Paenibacillus sp. P13VS TaxID=2697367 RepID=UPI001D102F5B|nr:hypothetical protein [Paenibacillus sp. P13VS]
MMNGVRKTKSGKYQVTFDQGMINGVRHKSTKVFDTLGEAEKALTEFKYNKQRNLLVTVNNMSLVELLDYWMKKYVKYNCEETTRYGYNNIISKHIAPYFAHMGLIKLQPMHIQDYYDHLIQVKGLSPNTVHKHHACIRKALDFGMKQQLVHCNVADAVELPKKEFFEGKSYTKEQLNEYFSGCIKIGSSGRYSAKPRIRMLTYRKKESWINSSPFSMLTSFG